MLSTRVDAMFVCLFMLL